MGQYFAYSLPNRLSRVRTYNWRMTAYILNLSCPDRTGIVHAVSGFLLERQGNIEEAAQYNDPDTGLFFMRVRFACDAVAQDDLRTQLLGLAEMLSMQWTLHDAPPQQARGA
jgi:formyltetrahydrofolate deformylase